MMFIPPELFGEPILCPYCLVIGDDTALSVGVLEPHLLSAHGNLDARMTVLVMWTAVEIATTRITLTGQVE